MPIGDSKGAFHEDEFRQLAAPWAIDPKMEINPDKMLQDKELDKVELDPTTGLGIEIALKTTEMNKSPNVEDRRSETPEWTMDRLMDPTPLDKSIGGENRKYGHGFLSSIKDPYFPTQLAKDLGINDMDAIKVVDYFKKLEIEPPEEQKSIKE